MPDVAKEAYILTWNVEYYKDCWLRGKLLAHLGNSVSNFKDTTCTMYTTQKEKSNGACYDFSGFTTKSVKYWKEMEEHTHINWIGSYFLAFLVKLHWLKNMSHSLSTRLCL